MEEREGKRERESVRGNGKRERWSVEHHRGESTLKFMTVINISPRPSLGACDHRNETPVKSPNELLDRRLIDVIGKNDSDFLPFE